MYKTILLALLFCSAGTCASAAGEPPADGPPIRKSNGILVDLKGRGLYTWDGDVVPGRSSCNGQCRLLWPPIVAAPGAVPKGPFTIVERDDGKRQWALRGRPLYRWASDKKFGDAGGGRVDKWHLVRVSASKPASAAADSKPSNDKTDKPR